MTLDFAADEYLRTEISAKFRPDGVVAELAAAGLETLGWWTDSDADYGMSMSVFRCQDDRDRDARRASDADG